ncbi:hypothetical protein [Streptomyces sp. NPDC059994]|uniref:hypothetical protein n=1 Tax=Streptomyces sp. NPDC059994 TaxID=3347029 RepID=UPI0036970563
MSIKHVRRAVVTAAAVTALVLAGATSASADGNATWRHKTSDDCLFYRVNGAGLPYDVGIDWCAASKVWYEQHNSDDDTWLMHPGANHDYCLAAYSNDDVHVEPCTPNNTGSAGTSAGPGRTGSSSTSRPAVTSTATTPASTSAPAA